MRNSFLSLKSVNRQAFQENWLMNKITEEIERYEAEQVVMAEYCKSIGIINVALSNFLYHTVHTQRSTFVQMTSIIFVLDIK